MMYAVDEHQLFRVWTAIRALGEIRQAQNRSVQHELLTDVQILLTAFVLDLQPLAGDENSSAKLGTDRDQTVKFDA